MGRLADKATIEHLDHRGVLLGRRSWRFGVDGLARCCGACNSSRGKKSLAARFVPLIVCSAVSFGPACRHSETRELSYFEIEPDALRVPGSVYSGTQPYLTPTGGRSASEVHRT